MLHNAETVNFRQYHDSYKTKVYDYLAELDSRIKFLSAEVTQYRIELDLVSHESCEVLISEIWTELEYIRKMVKWCVNIARTR